MFTRVRLGMGLVAVLLAGILVGGAQAQVKVRSHKVAMSSAKNYIQQRVLDKAVEMLERAIELKPEHPEAHFMLGAVYAEREMVDKMNEHFEQALALKKGDKYFEKGVKTSGASEFMRGGIKYSRNALWRQKFNSGVRALNGGKVNDAIANFVTASEVDPLNPGSYSAIGKVYVNMGRDSLDTAISWYNKALAIDTTLVEAYADMGIGQMNSGRLADAEVNLQKAHDLQPENVSICRALSNAQWAQGKKEAATATAEKALEIAPDDPKVLSLVGGLFTDMREFAKAVTALEKALEKDPENADIKFNLANAYLGTGDLDLATGLFIKSVENDPNDHQALYQLGTIYVQTGNYDGAIEALEKVTSLKPEWAKGWETLSSCYAFKANSTEGDVSKEAYKKSEEALNMFNALTGSGE